MTYWPEKCAPVRIANKKKTNQTRTYLERKVFYKSCRTGIRCADIRASSRLLAGYWSFGWHTKTYILSLWCITSPANELDKGIRADSSRSKCNIFFLRISCLKVDFYDFFWVLNWVGQLICCRYLFILLLFLYFN